MIELKYENGRDIFPERLLKQIQKYVSGKLVYIPSSDKKRAWGETSGYKQYLIERNRDIKSKFNAGASVEQLADEYYLSCESIKKRYSLWNTNVHCRQRRVSQRMASLKSGFIPICYPTAITRIFQTA